MSNYTPVYSRPYGEGFVNAPPYETPITAEVLNAYDGAIENIENYLETNPIEKTETVDLTEYARTDEVASKVDAQVSGSTLIVQLKTSSGDVISEKYITLPSGGVENNLVVNNSISLGRKSGTAIGGYSSATGANVMATEYGSQAEGEETEATGEASHAEGRGTKATASYSHAEGRSTKATGSYSHVEGNGGEASGEASHAEGMSSSAEGYCSHAEGYTTKATGYYSHAEGYQTNATTHNSHAEGSNTTASGPCSHAEGMGTAASQTGSHAEGQGTTASGPCSHAEGIGTAASQAGSHAEGQGTTASGPCSHAEGSGTKASSNLQHVQGKNNIEDTEDKYAHIVGNGESASNPSNAHTLDWQGNAWYSGTVEGAGIILTDTADSTKRYLVQVTDGQLAVSEVTGTSE